MKKRIFASVLAVLMIMSVVVFTPVFADDGVVITVRSADVAAGAAEAEIFVSVTNIPEGGLASARFNVKVEGASITSGTANKDLPETGYNVVGPTDKSATNGVNFMWVDVQGALTEDTELVAFTVALPTDAACGTELAVTVTLSDDPDDFIAGDGINTVAASAQAGKIVLAHPLTHVPAVEATAEADGNIEYWKCEKCGKYYSDAEATTEITAESTVVKYAPPFMLGDVDDNGKLNAKDVTAIMKYLVGATPAKFNELAADYDESGKINAKDVTKLMKALVTK